MRHIVGTYAPKPGDIERAWHVIDATDVRLGRLSVQVANLLRGKHKAIFAPNADTGDFVIVINAEKVSLSGTKRTTKFAYRHSGYPGGLTATPIGEVLDSDARKAIEKAVWGPAGSRDRSNESPVWRTPCAPFAMPRSRHCC